MKAWRPPRNSVSKSFQMMLKTMVRTRPSGMLPGVQATSPAIRAIMMPPAKMLPKSRSASVTGLSRSCEELEREHPRVGLEVVLEVALPALLADAEGPHADDDEEGHGVGEVGVAVGEGSRCVSSLSSVGISSSQLAIRMKKNSAIASGTTNGLSLAQVGLDLAGDLVMTVSQNSWILVGTWSSGRSVSLRAAQNPSPTTIAPATTVDADRVDVERHARTTHGRVLARRDLDRGCESFTAASAPSARGCWS